MSSSAAKRRQNCQKLSEFVARANKRTEHTLDAIKGWKSDADKRGADSQIQEKVNLGKSNVIKSVSTPVSHQIKVKTSIVIMDLRKISHFMQKLDPLHDQ